MSGWHCSECGKRFRPTESRTERCYSCQSIRDKRSRPGGPHYDPILSGARPRPCATCGETFRPTQRRCMTCLLCFRVSDRAAEIRKDRARAKGDDPLAHPYLGR